MKTPHPYAEILRAIADGEEIQFKSGSTWCDQNLETTLQEISDEDYPPDYYRVRPNVTMINDREVPEPLKELPAEGTKVYCPGFGIDASANLVEEHLVGYYPTLVPKLLALGLLHATREAAEAHAAALVSFTKRD